MDEKSVADGEQNDITVSETALNYEPKNGPMPGKRYTYSDYCTWDDGKRWELIDGIPYEMSAPNWRHQRILGKLYLKLGNYLEDKPCEVVLSPFDVRINANGADDTVVQPDILIICDHSKFTKAGSTGAPDMVVEILSPSTSMHDKVRKFRLYEESGVREFWIVDPELNHLTVHILDNGRYYVKNYDAGDTAPVHILEGFSIDLADIFAD